MITIELTVEQVNQVIEVLADRPYRQTATTIETIRTQALAQLRDAPVDPDPEVTE